MTIHRLWTLCIIGEPEDGGTPALRIRTNDVTHDEPEARSALEQMAHERYAEQHPGHVIATEWWAYEDMDGKS